MKNNTDSNDILVDSVLDVVNKKIKIKKGVLSITDSGVTLTNNEVKDIMKVIKLLENRGILLKATTRKISNQEGGFLNFLRPLVTAGLPLVKRALTPLAKNLLLPLGLLGGMSAADVSFQKKIYGSGTTALIISNEEMEDIIKIVNSREASGLFIKGISETIKNEAKE